jgi:ATP-binding cassette subfamily B multidrug efflux pump
VQGAMGLGQPGDKAGLDWGLTKRLLLRARAQWPQLGLAGLLLLCMTLGEQVRPLLVKHLVDRAVARDVAGVLSYSGYFLATILAVFSLQAWQTVQTKRMGQDLMLDLRGSLFAKIHAQSLRFFDQNPVGSLMTRVVYDAESLEEFFTNGVSAVFNDFFSLVIIAASLLILDWRLGLTALCLLPLLAWATILFRRRARENFRQIRANNAAMNASLTENLAGMATVQVFNRQERNAEKFDRLNRQSLDIQLGQVRINAIFLPLAELLSAFSMGLILWIGGRRMFHAQIPLGTVVAAVMYVQNLYQPLRDLTDKFSIFQSAMASSERIFALLDRREEVEDPADPLPLGPVRGELEFRHVTFGYEPGRDVLRDISFRVEAGGRLAVVGPTGSGKTSLVNVLLRFYPLHGGQVLLDGVDLSRVRRDEFRRHLALVPQDPFLFSGSLLENLRLSDEAVPQARVEWACQQVGADAFIRRLPGGYQAVLAEGGNNLSTGQKQLLSFARALVFDPQLLILDEATASVDTATEADIQKALEVLLKGRTSITIAHRLSTVIHSDRILVLKDGRLAEQGDHAQLMAQNGLYRGLIELQFKEQA